MQINVADIKMVTADNGVSASKHQQWHGKGDVLSIRRISDASMASVMKEHECAVAAEGIEPSAKAYPSKISKTDGIINNKGV